MQVGDPFTEKVLIECCLELIDAGLVVGIQDLGGAGLSCATSELASAGDGGMRIDLSAVPLRATGMTPAEILSSESQERMCAVVRPADVDEFLAICRKWDVLATVIGEVTDGDRLVITWHDETVVDVPPRTVAHDGPVYRRPVARSERQDALVADVPDTLPRPAAPSELRAEILRMVASPNLASRAWVTDQYDRYVRGNTVSAQPADAGMIRIDERDRARGGRRDRLQRPLRRARPLRRHAARAGRGVPERGDQRRRADRRHQLPQLRLAGGPARHVAVPGGRAGARRRLRRLGIPVTGGNVSFYNQTGDRAILPTPVVGRARRDRGRRRRVRPGFYRDGDVIVLLGETREEFGGSEWAHVAHGHLGGRPPAVDLDAEQRLAGLLAAAAADGLLTSAHDLSDGGLAQALVESCLIGGAGAMIDGLRRLDPFVALFSESAARVLVRCRTPRSCWPRAAAAGVPAKPIGWTGGNALGIGVIPPLPAQPSCARPGRRHAPFGGCVSRESAGGRRACRR